MAKKNPTPAVKAAEATVENLEEDLKAAEEAAEDAKSVDVSDVVAESAERRIEAASNESDKENIRNAEEVRKRTEAGEGPPDPNK